MIMHYVFKCWVIGRIMFAKHVAKNLIDKDVDIVIRFPQFH
jgi:hypothetical protein